MSEPQSALESAKASARSRFSPGADEVSSTVHRATGADAAVVFVHGFGSTGHPFGRLPELLAAEGALDGWDLHEISYNTGLLPDVRGLWAADPDITLLATYLRSRSKLAPLDAYASLASGEVALDLRPVEIYRRQSHVNLHSWRCAARARTKAAPNVTRCQPPFPPSPTTSRATPREVAESAA
jgi:hypothetical protein